MGRARRQLLWNAYSEDDPPRHTFSVLIINQERDINRIKQKLKEKLAPADEPELVTQGRITGQIHYGLFNITSYRTGSPEDFAWDSVYGGRVTRDRNLELRPTADGLANYVDNHAMALARS